MLQKLRSRHPIDLPAEGFGHKKAILAVLGGIAALFVLLPLALSPLGGYLADAPVAIYGIALGFGTLLFVLIATGIRGKPGWNRR